MNTISVSNRSDPDQDRHFVGSEMGPKCLKRLSSDDKIKELKSKTREMYNIL